MIKKGDIKKISQVLIIGALVAIILAVFGATGTDIWLASTQWLLVAAVMVGFGIYLRSER